MSENKECSTTRIFHKDITTKAVQIIAGDPKRKCFYIVNNGSATVYLLSAQNQKAEDGIPIAANGDYTNETSTARFWMIAESGTQDVRVEVDGE